MPKIQIKAESFRGRDGQDIAYERLLIASDKNPDIKLELRLDATQMTLAKLLLQSDGVSTPAPATK